MASLFQNRTSINAADYAKRMSSHLAVALVSFALLQIFVVARMGGSLLLHLGIIITIGLFALAARALERRWVMLSGSGLSDSGLATRFRVDLLQLWSTCLLGPVLWIPVSVVTGFLFG